MAVLPIFIVCRVSLFVVPLDICLYCLAAIGVTTVLLYASVSIMIFLQLAVTFVLSEENLPFVACCVLVYFNLWNSYRSFSQKYENLAAKLFEHYNRPSPGQQRINSNEDLNMQGIAAEHTQDYLYILLNKLFKQLPKSVRNMVLNVRMQSYWHTTDNVKGIPKDLFNTACEELMPLRKSICKMMLKASLSGIFIFFVFCLTMLLKASPLTATLVTFVAGLIPKFLIICDERRENRNFEVVFTEERAQEIVQKYINAGFPCNQKRNYHDYVFHKPENYAWVYTSFLISFISV